MIEKRLNANVIGGIVEKEEEKDLTSLIGDELEKAGIIIGVVEKT